MPKKVLLVTATWAPFDKKLRRLCKEVAEEVGAEFEVREEDWVFLTKYGEKAETGGADIPQTFVILEDGTVIHAFTKIPLDERGKPDPKRAREILLEKLK